MTGGRPSPRRVVAEVTRIVREVGKPWGIHFALACAVVLMGAGPSLAARSADDLAAEFASSGMAPVLAGCRLPERCGGQRPATASVTRRQTGNDNEVDERRLGFAGLEIDVVYTLGNASLPPGKRWYAKPYAHPFVREVIVRSPDWPVAQGLRVRTPRATVERTLGPGSPSSDDCVGYANASTQDRVEVCYRDDKVRSIHWVKAWDG